MSLYSNGKRRGLFWEVREAWWEILTYFEVFKILKGKFFKKIEGLSMNGVVLKFGHYFQIFTGILKF